MSAPARPRSTPALERSPAVESGRLVSVIVPARDPGAALDELLAALAAQTLARHRFEVIVGDDGSTDGSTRGLGSDDGWLRVAPGPRRNAAAARNRAVRLARAPILAFLDADCRPEATWLEAGLRRLERADLVGGLVRPRTAVRAGVWTLVDLDLHVDQERAVRSGRALGSNLFLRRELFQRLGGFDETLPRTEDTELVSRSVALGARLELAPDAVVWHPAYEDGGALLRKIWGTQRANGARDARSGQRPRILTLASVPVLGMLRSRRHEGRPLRLDPGRLEAAGARPGAWTEACALLLLYTLVPLVARLGRMAGWWQERRGQEPRVSNGTVSRGSNVAGPTEWR